MACVNLELMPKPSSVDDISLDELDDLAPPEKSKRQKPQ
jgi:hypothetical protein